MINWVLLNARANDATLVLSFTMRIKQQDPSDRLKSPIALHAPLQMLSIAA